MDFTFIWEAQLPVTDFADFSFFFKNTLLFLSLLLFIFWHAALHLGFEFPGLEFGILVPRSGTKLTPSALEVQSLKSWTTREVPLTDFSFN